MSSVEQIRKELEAFYKSYTAAFNGKDVSAISECFACPCALITGHGLNQCSTENDLQQLLGKSLADLKERGWTRSEMGQLKIWPMAEDLAMVVADGTVIGPMARCWSRCERATPFGGSEELEDCRDLGSRPVVSWPRRSPTLATRKELRLQADTRSGDVEADRILYLKICRSLLQ
jgi:hypothetical protein